MSKDTKKLLARLVQDHKIQCGIALAVAQNVLHFDGNSFLTRVRFYRVSEIINILKKKDEMLISDPDNVLNIVGRPARVNFEGSPKWVKRVNYISAVIILAANAIDIARQLRQPE